MGPCRRPFDEASTRPPAIRLIQVYTGSWTLQWTCVILFSDYSSARSSASAPNSLSSTKTRASDSPVRSGCAAARPRGDGLVADPARQHGVLNRERNALFQSWLAPRSSFSDFTYTPRQKLPRVIYSVYFGYGFTLD